MFFFRTSLPGKRDSEYERKCCALCHVSYLHSWSGLMYCRIWNIQTIFCQENYVSNFFNLPNALTLFENESITDINYPDLLPSDLGWIQHAYYINIKNNVIWRRKKRPKKMFLKLDLNSRPFWKSSIKWKMSSVLPTELSGHLLDNALNLKIDQYNSIFH